MFPSVAIGLARPRCWSACAQVPGCCERAWSRCSVIDIRPILPTIAAPTLVIHASDDPIPVQCGRYLADNIPRAKYLEIEGCDHAPWLTDPDRILTAIEEFLTGSHSAPAQSHRALRTVMFTDMVASTEHAAAAGDERWRAVLQRFGEITGDLAEQFGGMVVKSTGDGYLVTFDGPTQAIRCAEALCHQAETLGIEIRVGIHTGECELLDTDIGGIAVHIASRILGQAGAGEILVSRTVGDLVVGSGTAFDDRGNVELRGVPGTWQLLAVDRDGARRDRPRRNWRLRPLPALGPRCAGRTVPLRRSQGEHRGSSAGWPASPRPPVAAGQRRAQRPFVRQRRIYSLRAAAQMTAPTVPSGFRRQRCPRGARCLSPDGSRC